MGSQAGRLPGLPVHVALGNGKTPTTHNDPRVRNLLHWDVPTVATGDDRRQ